MRVNEYMAQTFGSRPENIGDGRSVGNVVQFTSAATSHLPVELWTEAQLQLYGHLAQFAVSQKIAEEKGLVTYRVTTEEVNIMHGFGIHRDTIVRDIKSDLIAEEEESDDQDAGVAGGGIPPTSLLPQ